jgi:hypothetical protein
MLFDNARERLASVGLEIGSWSEHEELYWEGFMDGIRSSKDAVRMLAPGVTVDAPKGREFYISFQPMKIANELHALTSGEVTFKSVELDAEAMRWAYEMDGQPMVVGGDGKVLERFVSQVNAARQRRGDNWRFVVVIHGRQHKVVATDAKDATPLQEVLGRKAKPLTAPPAKRTLPLEGLGDGLEEVEWIASTAPKVFALVPGAPALQVERREDVVALRVGNATATWRWRDSDWAEGLEWVVTTLDGLHETDYRLSFVRLDDGGVAIAALKDAEVAGLGTRVLSVYELS